MNSFMHLLIPSVIFYEFVLHSYGGGKAKEIQLWKTAVYQQLVFQLGSCKKRSVIELVFKYYIQRFIQTNLLMLKSC